MKLLMLVVFLLFLLPIASARITDTVYTIQPNSLECFDLNIPEDFGVINARVQFFITSTCGKWCDFVQSVITTDNTNPVTLPICINADGRRIGEQTSFNVNIQGQGQQKDYTINVCVHETADRDDNPGSGSPCVLASRKQDNFDIVVNPNPIYITPGGSVQYSLSVYSQDALNLEIESSTGNTWSVTTTPKKTISLYDVVKDSASALTVTGRIKNCPVDSSGNTISECVKKTTVPVYVTNQNPPGNFTISLSPLNINDVRRGENVSYMLEVNNLGEPKEFVIDVIVPEGFASGFSRTTKTISGKETFSFIVTPEQSISQSFSVIVRTADGEKSERPFISVDEIITDIQKSKDTTNNPPKINKCLGKHSSQSSGSGIADQVNSWGDFVDCTNEPDIGQGSAGSENNIKVDTLFIAIPIAVIALVLLFYFYKKKQPVDEEKEEDW